MHLNLLLRRLTRPLTAKITRDELDRFIAGRATTDKTLDLGAGNSPYRTCFPNQVGVDIRALDGVDVICDAHDLAFRDTSFDTVLCSEVLEHLCEPQRAANEMFRVLKAGGRVVLTTRFVFPIHDAPGDYYRYTRYGLQYLLRKFEITQLREEIDTMGTLAILMQRLAIQTETPGWRPFRLAWHILARVIRRLSFLIAKEYGNSPPRQTEPAIMTTGYHVECRKPLDVQSDWSESVRCGKRC